MILIKNKDILRVLSSYSPLPLYEGRDNKVHLSDVYKCLMVRYIKDISADNIGPQFNDQIQALLEHHSLKKYIKNKHEKI